MTVLKRIRLAFNMCHLWFNSFCFYLTRKRWAWEKGLWNQICSVSNFFSARAATRCQSLQINSGWESTQLSSCAATNQPPHPDFDVDHVKSGQLAGACQWSEPWSGQLRISFTQFGKPNPRDFYWPSVNNSTLKGLPLFLRDWIGVSKSADLYQNGCLSDSGSYLPTIMICKTSLMWPKCEDIWNPKWCVSISRTYPRWVRWLVGTYAPLLVGDTFPLMWHDWCDSGEDTDKDKDDEDDQDDEDYKDNDV